MGHRRGDTGFESQCDISARTSFKKLKGQGRDITFDVSVFSLFVVVGFVVVG